MTEQQLAKYEAAERALAEADAVDEVLEIRGQAEAWRAYAKQAQNRDLEIKAARIRFRAERRLGELIVAQKETIGLNQGRAGAGRPRLGDSSTEQPKTDDRPTLEQAGIDRKLSSKAQRLAAIDTAEFERALIQHAEQMKAGQGRVAMDLLKVGAEEKGRAHRRDLAQGLSDQSAELPAGRRYPAVYIDLPWKREGGIGDRAYENHYPTMSWPEILEFLRGGRGSLLPDSWAFFWIPRAHLLALVEIELEVTIAATGERVPALVEMPLGWAVGHALGMDNYSTCFVWTKTDVDHPDVSGSGLIAWDQDELLLLFKRGRGLPKPSGSEKYGSNHRERPREHSRKPDHYRKMIADMVGCDSAGNPLPVLEMFARVDAEHPLPPGWDACGNQASAAPNVVEEIPCRPDAGPQDQERHSRTNPVGKADAAGTIISQRQILPGKIVCVRGTWDRCDDHAACETRGECKLYPFAPTAAKELAPAASGPSGLYFVMKTTLPDDEFVQWIGLSSVRDGRPINGDIARGLIGTDHLAVIADDRLALTENGRLLLRSLELFVERSERREGRTLGISLDPPAPVQVDLEEIIATRQVAAIAVAPCDDLLDIPAFLRRQSA